MFDNSVAELGPLPEELSINHFLRNPEPLVYDVQTNEERERAAVLAETRLMLLYHPLQSAKERLDSLSGDPKSDEAIEAAKQYSILSDCRNYAVMCLGTAIGFWKPKYSQEGSRIAESHAQFVERHLWGNGDWTDDPEVLAARRKEQLNLAIGYVANRNISD